MNCVIRIGSESDRKRITIGSNRIAIGSNRIKIGSNRMHEQRVVNRINSGGDRCYEPNLPLQQVLFEPDRLRREARFEPNRLRQTVSMTMYPNRIRIGSQTDPFEIPPNTTYNLQPILSSAKRADRLYGAMDDRSTRVMIGWKRHGWSLRVLIGSALTMATRNVPTLSELLDVELKAVADLVGDDFPVEITFAKDVGSVVIPYRQLIA